MSCCIFSFLSDKQSMNSESLLVAIIVAVLVAGGVVVYREIFSDPSKTNKTKGRMLKPSNLAHVVSGAEYAAQNMAGHQQWNPVTQTAQQLQSQNTASSCSGMSKEPAPYFPYTPQGQGGLYDNAYPNEQDRSSLQMRGGNAASLGSMNINQLLPASWRPNAQPTNAAEMGSDALWTKYAPTRQAFDQYVTAAGSARLRLNTRSPLGRQTGIVDLTRAPPQVPLTADNFVFNDSSMRLDLVQRATGRYPTSTNC